MKQYYYTSILSYLTDLQSIPRLSVSDLDYTIEMYRLTKSIELRNSIVSHYLHFIPQLLPRYSNCSIPIEDLLQIANTKLISLVDAIVFNNITGTKSITAYIVKSIHNTILNAIQYENKFIA